MIQNIERVVVVVGHGTSPENKRWGQKIDRAHAVVRMWNWHYQWKRPWDYGTHYDWGFYEILPTELSRMGKYNKANPRVGWIASDLTPPKKPYDGLLPKGSIKVNSGPLEQRAIGMGGMGTKGKIRLTRGVCAAAFMLTRMFEGDRLILVGFDNAYAGVGLSPRDAFPADYLTDPATFPLRNYQGGTTKYSNHDYAVERPLLEALAEEARIQLSWAQEYWE